MNILIIGPKGAGKTFLADMMNWAYKARGHSVNITDPNGARLNSLDTLKKTKCQPTKHHIVVMQRVDYYTAPHRLEYLLDYIIRCEAVAE